MLKSALVAFLFTVASLGAVFAEPGEVHQNTAGSEIHDTISETEVGHGHPAEISEAHHETSSEADVQAEEHEVHSITHLMMHLILQLAVIIVAAKIGGYVFQKYFKMPSVLGELASGMVIGPYALGKMIDIPTLGLLFPLNTVHDFAASPQLYGIATLASIILLFLAGLETDLAAFIRYSVVGSFVGLGGLIAAFVIGDAQVKIGSKI